MGNEFMITPIQKNKVYEDISTQIKKQIEDGTWKEGERIQGEIELAKEFQVGRSSIREAIKSLQVLGILEARTGQGTYIAPNALQRINDNRLMEMMSNEHYYDEILQGRLILESQAAYLAAKQCTEEDIAYLQKNYEEMVEDTLQGRDEESEKKGHEFHAYIVKMLHNDVLMALYNSLVQMVLEEREEFEKDSELEEVLSYHREHGEVIQALKDHDAERARKIVEYHLTRKMRNK